MHTNQPSLSLTRGRPREFDPKDAVKRAMNVFWSNGYSGTSLPDLLKATRLSRSSLYAAFGDKRGLFLRALEQYIEESNVRIDSSLQAPLPALERVRACLNGYVDRSCGPGGKRGCLLIATAMELTAKDAEVGKRIRKFFDSYEKRLTATMALAQQQGELAEGVEPAHAARVLLCMMEGLRVVGKTGLDEASWRLTIDALVARFKK
jgi:TetR/AcrR family transcriptional repressor of nem operon